VVRIIRNFSLVLLVLSGLIPLRAMAQIAPLPYTSVPAAAAEAPSAKPGTTSKDAPKAFIRGWSFGSELDASTIQHRDSVSLDPGHPEIILFFDAQALPEAPVEFRYRLTDYDADWTGTMTRVAHYRKLTPGEYRFEVQARTPGQPWPAETAVLMVRQKPFFYQTWYFYLLLLLGLIALAAQLLSQRDQLLKGQMGMVLEERNRIASDCHDTLMAGFAAISWQLEATAKLFKDADASGTPAAVSCELARSMVAHCQAEARRIIWDLRDSDELTNVLSQALGRAIEAHRLRDSVKTTFDVQGDEIPIAPGAVHHLVCIGQEAVTNAIRHSEASTIRINLRYESDALSLTIQDNGRGFQISDPSTRAGHFGIPVMEERARKLGGSLRMASSADTGTEVAVTVSFQTINLPPNQQHYIVPWIGV
jgi:signal transduction histidine kinase